MKFRQNPFLNSLVSLGIAAGAGLLFVHSAHALTGTWSADSTPLFWNAIDTGNWASGIVADGSGFTANFTNDITGDRVVNLDADKTITNIVFGDSDTASAGSWTLGNNLVSTNNLILAGTTPTVTVNALGTGKTATISAIIEGTAGLTKAGTGTLILTGANTYSGTTTIGEGTLAFTTAAPNLTGGLTFGATAGSTTTSALDLSNGSATFNGATLVQTNSATANTISVGSGRTLTLNNNVTIGYNANNTTTKLAVSGLGALAVNKSGGIFQVGGSTTNATTGNAATLDLSGLTTFTADLGSTGIFRVGDSNATGGGSALTLGNTSTLVLANTSTITAGTVGIADVTAGTATMTLKLGSTSTLIKTNNLVVGGKTVASNFTRGNGVLQFDTGTGTLKLRDASGAESSRAIVDIANNNTSTTNATITGEINLSGHSSDLRISTLTIASKTGSNGNVNGTFTFGTGTLDITSAILGKRVNRGGGTSTAILNIEGGTSNFGSIAMGDSNTSGGIANGTLNLTGGTVTLAGNITRTGGAGTTSATLNLKGATLDMGGFNIGGANAVTLTAESGTLKNVAQINNGTGGLTKTTAGTLILDGTNTYTGTTEVNEGTLLATKAAALPGYNAASKVSVVSGATLAVRAGGAGEWSSAEIDSVLGATTAAFASGSKLGIDVTTSNSFSYANDIGATQAAKGLVKSGAGTLTLAGTNNYTGATSVTAGKLIVNGNISTSATTVQNSGILGGSGTLGSVTIQSGGTLAPGNSIESLGINGGLTLESGSFSVFEINTTGNISDLAIISGLLTFGGTLNVNNVGGALVNGDTFDLFNWGSKSGTFSAVSLPTLDPGLTWDQSQLYTTGTLSVVPESSAALLGGLGMLALLRRRR